MKNADIEWSNTEHIIVGDSLTLKCRTIWSKEWSMNPCHHTSGRHWRRVERESAKAAGKGHREQDSPLLPFQMYKDCLMFNVYAVDAEEQFHSLGTLDLEPSHSPFRILILGGIKNSESMAWIYHFDHFESSNCCPITFHIIKRTFRLTSASALQVQ